MSKKESIVQILDNWHHTSKGYIVFTVSELALAYAFVSLAIDSGSLWYYAIAIILLIGAVQNFVRLLLRLLPKKK